VIQSEAQAGNQIGIGFYQIFSINSIEASAELYYKKISNIADFKGGAKLVMNEFIEQDIVNVEGKAYGLELLIKRPGEIAFLLGIYLFKDFYKEYQLS